MSGVANMSLRPGDREYRTMLDNGRPLRRTALATDGKVLGDLLRGVAARARHARAAEKGWSQVAAPEWLALTEIESSDRGVVRIAVRDPALWQTLQRNAAALSREMSRLVPGVQRLRFILPTDSAAGERPE